MLLAITLLIREARSEVTVITEEYVPKVIIEAKWGTNEGEFGKTYHPFYDDRIVPDSLAVDSKGNIYILDKANNRIQKFDSSGKYLKSINVPSWKGYYYYTYKDSARGEILPSEAEGINITIDNKDRLYYYFIKEQYKKLGEVDKDRDNKITFRRFIK